MLYIQLRTIFLDLLSYTDSITLPCLILSSQLFGYAYAHLYSLSAGFCSHQAYDAHLFTFFVPELSLVVIILCLLTAVAVELGQGRSKDALSIEC
jgi:hypothetical protein